MVRTHAAADCAGASWPPPAHTLAAASKPTARPADSSQHRPRPAPTAVAAALRADCNINAHAFVVVGLDDAGHAFVLPSDKFDHFKARLAQSAEWRELQQSLEQPVPPLFQRAAPPFFAADAEPPSQDWADAASQATTDSDESRRASLASPTHQLRRRSVKTRVKLKSPRIEPARLPRKRQRSSSRNQSLAEDDDDDNEDWPADAEPEEQPTDRFPIEDMKKVIYNLGLRLDQMQQLACKVILKAWIRAIEPKKQSNFPYVGSDPKKKVEEKAGQKKRAKPKEGPDAPLWWPQERQDWWSLLLHPKCKDMKHVRHKEPDHLRKEERLILGVHILLHQAHKDNGIELLVHSTKDCVLQFDQDNDNGSYRKGKRDRFLSDIYDLAQNWSDFVTGGIDGDTVFTLKQYPKQALATKKAGSASSRKRARQDSSVESQETQQAPLPPSQDQDDLIQSTDRLGLESSTWDPRLPNGLPDPPQQVNGFFQDGSYRFGPMKHYSDPSDMQPAFQHTPMMPPQPVYEDMQSMPSRYPPFDAKQPTGFMDNTAYPMSREASYVSQPTNYSSDWRAVQSNPPFSPASTASLAQSSNVSYTPSNTSFPGSINYPFGSTGQMSPSHPYHSTTAQVSALSAASPDMQQQMTAPAQPLMMQGIRSQSGSFDQEHYGNAQFRTGSLGHPNIPYNMNNQQYP